MKHVWYSCRTALNHDASGVFNGQSGRKLPCIRKTREDALVSVITVRSLRPRKAGLSNVAWMWRFIRRPEAAHWFILCPLIPAQETEPQNAPDAGPLVCGCERTGSCLPAWMIRHFHMGVNGWMWQGQALRGVSRPEIRYIIATPFTLPSLSWWEVSHINVILTWYIL